MDQFDLFEDSEDDNGKPIKWCKCCEQRIRPMNKHVMCRAKVQLLNSIAREGGFVKISSGMKIQRMGDAGVLALRLKWFGLVESGGKRSGLYRATKEGIDFLRGLHMVPKTIYCRDGRVLDRDTTLVSVYSVRKVVLDREYWDNYGKEQT
jgi:hypothetical protein